MKPARIVLADGHVSILGAAASLLQQVGFRIVGRVASGNALVAAAESLQPDILVVALSLPGLSGIEAVELIRQSGSSARVVFLDVRFDSDFIQAAFAAGGFGYVLKSQMVKDLARAVSDALEGRVFVSSPLAARTEH